MKALHTFFIGLALVTVCSASLHPERQRRLLLELDRIIPTTIVDITTITTTANAKGKPCFSQSYKDSRAFSSAV
jgi:hypothetical protein